MEEWMIKVEHLSKEYQLGAIGATTLRDALQRRKAKLLKKEDPLSRVDVLHPLESITPSGKFSALQDVSFTINKGERIGIIGANGAGKSTLLKLISHITLPTKGDIWLKGRVASMLEVGTGFHQELTGRENIYMNGAVLGMKKKEIDRKLDQIIAFSECEQFIDTPVKRYSSGMYVKLAFAVAAHLDSEILIMDEVLAVGDMAFQKKCLTKMEEAANQEGRTVLYVSHNMNTIRQLCERTIVLDHGKLVFDGNTEQAIGLYMQNNLDGFRQKTVFSSADHMPYCSHALLMRSVFVHADSNVFSSSDCFDITFEVEAKKELPSVRLMLIVFYQDSFRVAKTESSDFSVSAKHQSVSFRFSCSGLADGQYYMEASFLTRDADSGQEKYDSISHILPFTIENPEVFGVSGQEWKPQYWGHMMLAPVQVLHKSLWDENP